MDFRITIDNAGGIGTPGVPGQSGQAPQQYGGGTQDPAGSPASAPPPVSAPWQQPAAWQPGGEGLMGADRAAGREAARASGEKERLEAAKVAISAELQMAAVMREEAQERAKGLENLKLRMKLESPAAEAARIYEEDILLRQRMLDVTRERHKIEGSAAEEARLQLEGQKEAKEWQRKVNEERRRQDPGAAQAEDLGALGGLLGQASGGRGLAGSLGRLLQMAPQIQEQMSQQQQPSGGKGGGGGDAAQMAAKAAQSAAKGTGGGSAGAAGAAEGAAGAAAGAEGAMAGVAGGMAAAAGPIGIAIAVAQEYNAAKEAAVQGAIDGVKGVTQGMGDLAGNNFLKPVTSAVDAFADMANYVPVVGEAFGMLAKVGMGTVGAVAELQNQFLELGERIKPYSGALLAAQASIEMRTMAGDIREAEQIGPVLARLAESQNKTNEAMREMVGPLKRLGAEGVTIPQEIIEKLATRMNEKLLEWGIVQFLNGYVDSIANTLRRWFDLDPLAPDDELDHLVRQAAVRGGMGEFGRPGEVNAGRAAQGGRMFAGGLPNGGF